MATHTYINLDIPEAIPLKNLIGIEYDLKQCKEWCERYISIRSDILNIQLSWLSEPLTTAILIFLGRALEVGGGVRNKMAKQILSALSKSEEDQYEYFITIRNKYIAHSVNEYERNFVRGQYTVERIESGIQSIGEGCERVIAMSIEDAERIIGLCDILLKKIKAEKETHKEKVLKIVCKYSADIIRGHIDTPIKRTSEMKIKKTRNQ